MIITRFAASLALLAFGCVCCSAMELRREPGRAKDSFTLIFSAERGTVSVFGVRLKNDAPVLPVYCADSGRQYAEATLLSSAAYAAAAKAIKTGHGSIAPSTPTDCLSQKAGLCVTSVRQFGKPNRLKISASIEGALGLEFMLTRITNSKTGGSYWRMYGPDTASIEPAGFRAEVRALAVTAAETFCETNSICSSGDK